VDSVPGGTCTRGWAFSQSALTACNAKVRSTAVMQHAAGNMASMVLGQMLGIRERK
jgi:hypothetical protein